MNMLWMENNLNCVTLHQRRKNAENYAKTVDHRYPDALLSEGLLQAEAVEHFAGDNDHVNHEL